MSSTIAAAVRKMRSSTGTRLPSITISATAKAVSVAIGTPQPCAHGSGGMISRIEHRRHHHAADRRRDRQRRGAPAGQMADGELALDLEADDQEEDRQQAVVDPVQQRHAEAGVAEGEARGPAARRPQRPGPSGELVSTTASTVASSSSTPADGAQLGEVERGRAHAMAERARASRRRTSFRPTGRRSGGR